MQVREYSCHLSAYSLAHVVNDGQMEGAMTRREKQIGKCLLLGSEGPFARSHIIPRFVADKALGQAHRIEMGQLGARPKLVFNSWTDHELCGQKGEERLRDIDTAASKVFRK